MLDGSRTLVIDDEEWTIESLLGSGGFASVYQATGESGRSAAIKMVDVAKHPAPAKLRTEADSLMRAQTHSNVIRLLIEERRGPHHFFVMESWGRDLCELGLEQHGLSEASVQHIMVQVLRALSWLHEMRICHGDVKPDNLLCARVDGVDIIKLADFGSAVQMPPEGIATVDPIAQGTRSYSPPEVLQGQAFSYSADIWSAGVTTYALLSGCFPFHHVEDVLHSTARFDGATWRAISLHACGFIRSLLQHEPCRRPSANEALCHPWLARQLAIEVPQSPRPTTPGLSIPAPLQHPSTAAPLDLLQPFAQVSAQCPPPLAAAHVSGRSCTSALQNALAHTPTKRKAQARDSSVADEHGSAGSTAGFAPTADILLLPAKKRLGLRQHWSSASLSSDEPELKRDLDAPTSPDATPPTATTAALHGTVALLPDLATIGSLPAPLGTCEEAACCAIDSACDEDALPRAACVVRA